MRQIGLVVLGAALLLSRAAWAQDQVEILDDAMKPLVLSGTLPNARVLTYTQARDFVERTLQAQDNPAKHYVDDPKFYCLIHAVAWKAPASDTAKPEVDFKRWYVFRGGSGWGQLDLEGARLYGSHTVAVLALHWTQSVDTGKDAMAAAVAKDDPTLTQQQIDVAVARLQDDLNHGRAGNLRDSNGSALVIRDGIPYVHGFPPEAPVRYRMEVTGKLPAPWAHLAEMATAVAHSNGTRLPNKLQIIWSGRLFQVKNVPSDIVLRLLFTDSLSELDNQTFDNEGRYRFDFSAGIPLKSTKQVQYETAGGAVTPVSVDKTTVFGLFDYFFKPVDVSTNYKITQPYLVTGLGLTGRPWERTMIGLGFGYSKVSGFIGANWNRVQNGTTTMNGITTPNKQWDASPKLVFGINITSKQLADLFKPKK